MKKSLLALAVLSAIAGSAAAQSSVTMYGIADVGVVRESGNPAGSVTKLTSGVSAGSRLGFRGVEDLGNGMAALFVLETGINFDTGGNAQQATSSTTAAPNPGGNPFARQTFVGVKSSAGTLTMGRQYNPYFKTVAAADPFGAGQEGNSGNIMAFTGSNGRSDNSILYVSPSFSGFGGEVLYGMGEVAGQIAQKSVINAAITYANGPLSVRLASQRLNNANATGTVGIAKNTILGLTYDFGVAKLQAAYATAKGVGSVANGNETTQFNRAANIPYRPFPTGAAVLGATNADTRDYLIGTTIPVGAGNILASYINRDDRTASNQDANQFAIGYEYNLSKRTVLYTAYSRISNKNGAGYTVGNAGDISGGSGDKGLAAGVRHTF